MDNAVVEFLFNPSMSAFYIGIGSTLVAIAIAYVTITVPIKKFTYEPLVILSIFAVLSFALCIVSINSEILFSNSETIESETIQIDNVKPSTTVETSSTPIRTNGTTTIIQERNKGNCYDDYEEVKVTSDFNENFNITNCGTVNISGSHNDGFTISNCESVIVSSHNNSFVIKSCKEVEVSGSHCDAIIIIDCPSVKVLDGYNKIYLVNSKLKQDGGKDNQIQKMTIEDLKNSDMGYLVEDN